ncbi:MAG: hypothetical protein JOZ58_27655 [Acetobacteraceae bacterium]|nr:hypothetical protein [Acetobacteraceae bacterium]MBV8578797.1 hypothetical protein [Acetobacteraceae bacterium]
MNNGWTSRALARPLLSEARQRWVEAREERRHRRRVADELHALTDRELLELGFYRADVAAIANGTYRR